MEANGQVGGGETVPLAARIVAVADAFDAMTSVRPYRGPTSVDRALSELEQAGTWTYRGLVICSPR